MKIKICDVSRIGTKIPFTYETNEYYDFEIKNTEFKLVRKKLKQPILKSFDFNLMEDWLEKPILYGAFEEDKILGFIELSKESWNQRMRITNLYVNEGYRHQHIGTLLMNQAKQEAYLQQCRSLVLETQSCNTKAIDFYFASGFQIIGFDLQCYSNEDIQKKEVRIEMGYIVTKNCCNGEQMDL